MKRKSNQPSNLNKFFQTIDRISIEQMDTFITFMLPIFGMVLLAGLFISALYPYETSDPTLTNITKSSSTLDQELLQICPDEWVFSNSNGTNQEYFIYENTIIDFQSLDIEYVVNECDLTPKVLSNPSE